jgi:hypothetical protein
MIKGYKQNLTKDDMWLVEENKGSKKLSNELEIVWNKAIKKYILKAFFPRVRKNENWGDLILKI